MILLDILDSLQIQKTVETVSNIGINLLPGDWQILAPAISSILTLITAAIIRAIEKAQIKKEEKKKAAEIIQAYLSKDEIELAKKIHELQKTKL